MLEDAQIHDGRLRKSSVGEADSHTDGFEKRPTCNDHGRLEDGKDLKDEQRMHDNLGG